MHDAYEAEPILEKLPLQIESIACHGKDVLLVGTKQGHLLVYSIKSASGDERFAVNLLRSNKSFAKKPIQQLTCVPEFQILISLSDNVISVHDLTGYSHITALNKTRGATLFAVDLQKEKSLSGGCTYKLRMCVAVKRKLQLFYWQNRDFHELQSDLGVPDVPKSMSWCVNSLCVGFKRDYFLIKLDGGLKELFPTGKQLEPTVTRLAEDKLALGRDEMSIFIDSEGAPTQKYALTWNDIPIIIEYDAPYMIAVLPRYVEIRTIEPRLLVQSIDLQKPRFITLGSGHVYIASSHFVWRLVPVPITVQIRELLQDKQFELALHLADMTDEVEADKQRRIQHIQNLYAFDLFSQHRFEESMQIFGKLGTDPAQVIGLFPDLLPQDYRNQLEYPSKPPELSGSELEKGLLGLIEYLTHKRNEIVKHMSQELSNPMAIVQGSTTIRSKKQLSQIVDTTLLKCYLQTNDALVAPLLRLKDNNCHIEESERVLKKHQKYSELIILYQKKGLHRKALDLLLRQSQKPNSPLKGHDRTVQYLQHLGSDHFDLISDFALWVLKAYPEDGLKIFTEDTPEVDGLPRDKVLAYLEQNACTRDLAVPYLEHIILNCHEDNPEFHNKLIHLYRERVQVMMKDYILSLPEGQDPAKTGKEPGDLGELRNKLLFFLETSLHYVPEKLLTYFPFDSFFEERALLLGRLGRHEQALAIYAHILKDTKMAEDYCRRNYDPDKEGNKNVYLCLLKMYINPPDASTLGVMVNAESAKPNIDASLCVLKLHQYKIDMAKALDLIPSTVQVKDVCKFLECVLEDGSAKKRNNQILKSLLYSEHLQVKEQKIYYQSSKCTITDEKICKVCKKKIGNSAFARYPNGIIVHFYCCKDRNFCPFDV
ncbi:vam6/Vps39-like protein [Saccoglossus kowalevskii]|uniref:Vam6/Vps39-like protein-like n=1 Tax=Saccoglossus kowalevskii TaxID=10224 RepID=A0ABM0N0H9_SACKO|nr:PREDICTED: vam6/Vps39-like protein-like [Saccoglossus kowalevskii]